MSFVFLFFLQNFDIYKQALEFQSEDKPCLVARSKCFLKLGRASEALEDAETSLKDDNKYYRVSYISDCDTQFTKRFI